MPNTQGVSISFKQEILQAMHVLSLNTTRTVTTADVFRAPLYVASATVNPSLGAYTTANEVSGTNYVTGGVTITWQAVSTSGSTAFSTPNASIVYTNVTLSNSFDTVLLYNSTMGNRAVAVYTFGAQTITAGNFTMTMPTNDSSNALLRLA